MRNIPREFKNKVINFVKANPDFSYIEIAKQFGITRHTVSAWVRNKDRNPNQKERVAKHRQILIEFLGGCCYECGYSGPALDFHHRDPSQKTAQLADLFSGNFEKAADEARKCVLLCCRCHREKHNLNVHNSMNAPETVNTVLSEISPYISDTFGVGHLRVPR